MIILIGNLAFLLGPILALSYIEGKHGRLAVVCISISGFGLLITVITKSRTFEIAAATAALVNKARCGRHNLTYLTSYAAVVVVFLGAI